MSGSAVVVANLSPALLHLLEFRRVNFEDGGSFVQFFHLVFHGSDFLVASIQLVVWPVGNEAERSVFTKSFSELMLLHLLKAAT